MPVSILAVSCIVLTDPYQSYETSDKSIRNSLTIYNQAFLFNSHFDNKDTTLAGNLVQF